MSPAPQNELPEEVGLFYFTSPRHRLRPVDDDTVINQPPAGRRVTVPEAAVALGLTVEAIRGRIKRGKLPHVKEGGTVYVLLPADQTTAGRNQSSDQSGLVEELRDRVRRLEHDLDVRSEEIRRKDHIIAGLVNRIPELSAPASTDEAQGVAQDAEEGSGRGNRTPRAADGRTAPLVVA